MANVKSLSSQFAYSPMALVFASRLRNLTIWLGLSVIVNLASFADATSLVAHGNPEPIGDSFDYRVPSLRQAWMDIFESGISEAISRRRTRERERFDFGRGVTFYTSINPEACGPFLAQISLNKVESGLTTIRIWRCSQDDLTILLRKDDHGFRIERSDNRGMLSFRTYQTYSEPKKKIRSQSRQGSNQYAQIAIVDYRFDDKAIRWAEITTENSREIELSGILDLKSFYFGTYSNRRTPDGFGINEFYNEDSQISFAVWNNFYFKVEQLLQEIADQMVEF